jgi:hypothetical protein
MPDGTVHKQHPQMVVMSKVLLVWLTGEAGVIVKLQLIVIPLF